MRSTAWKKGFQAAYTVVRNEHLRLHEEFADLRCHDDLSHEAQVVDAKREFLLDKITGLSTALKKLRMTYKRATSPAKRRTK